MRTAVLCALGLLVSATSAIAEDTADYRVLAANKTSTMQKEMNEAAGTGFQFSGVMGGDTSFGSSEVVVIMSKAADAKSRYEYKLLATSKTSTMQKEMQDAGDVGFEYRGQSVFTSTCGGKEVVVILERDKETTAVGGFEYRLMATKKTSTFQKELGEAGDAGYQFVGMTVADTSLGGIEVVAILRRKAK